MFVSQEAKSEIIFISSFVATLAVFFTLALSAPHYFEKTQDTPQAQIVDSHTSKSESN